ncbi:ATP-binding mismatch repair protein SCDLUD_002828 [Saccharomycodes ludwigii]|uniref:ATP-binding mismatch repair protein n=1 Tax=Saccharomycodes ludwigii TaxID=36035 RepID=UPI001E8A4A2E|nr:hypothetical protein SCDLUD_002828 [Saccharomycodes ludwigii]KAH3901337.1 hypothetical protein SCDLUD_002828 [Saccharomycodes ludwigii]
MSIQKINKVEVHSITSGQVIIDLTSCVKELLENSIDSGATKIEITFKNYGLESIEVNDNGCGISKDNFQSLCLKHFTSKISCFEDLSNNLSTLGFRGEALSSLCCLTGGNLQVLTSCETPPKGNKLLYDTNGQLIDCKVASRNKGTTITVSHLFSNLPVRRKDFEKNHKRKFTHCCNMIQDHAIIQDGITITVWNISSNHNRKNLILSSAPINKGIPKNFTNIFGSNAMKGLGDCQLILEISPKKSFVQEYSFEGGTIVVNGYISQNSFGCGRPTKDRQFLYFNKRPVDYPLIVKIINEVYRSFNNVQYPAFILDFEISVSMLDVNVTPDKRTMLLHNESDVLEQLREALVDYFNKQEMVLPTNNPERIAATYVKKEEHNPIKDTSVDESESLIKFKRRKTDSTDSGNNNTEPSKVEATMDSIISQYTPTTSSLNYTTEKVSIFDVSSNTNNEEKHAAEDTNATDSVESDKQATEDTDDTNSVESDDQMGLEDNKETKSISKHEPHTTKRPNIRSYQLRLDAFSKRVSGNEKDEDHPCCDNSLENGTSVGQESGNTKEEDLIIELDDIKIHEKLKLNTKSKENTKLDIEGHENDEAEDADSSKMSVLNERQPLASSGKTTKKSSVTIENTNKEIIPYIPSLYSYELEINDIKIDAIIKKTEEFLDVTKVKHLSLFNKNDKIEDKDEGENFLTLTVSKSDFTKMKIVGQFNLGFIICTRYIPASKKYDLFIVDQHASDEKYNFEMLQKSHKFKHQYLLRPQPMELSLIDELIVLDNIPIFEANGFKLQVDDKDGDTGKIKLLSLPTSKRVMFDFSDFYELIHLIKEQTADLNHNNCDYGMVRCSKIRSMFAMRSCRMSIMIGKPLTTRTMQRVVHNLGELDKPWNCPHGRPTMRHLMELKDWDSFNNDYEL